MTAGSEKKLMEEMWKRVARSLSCPTSWHTTDKRNKRYSERHRVLQRYKSVSMSTLLRICYWIDPLDLLIDWLIEYLIDRSVLQLLHKLIQCSMGSVDQKWNPYCTSVTTSYKTSYLEQPLINQSIGWNMIIHSIVDFFDWLLPIYGRWMDDHCRHCVRTVSGLDRMI